MDIASAILLSPAILIFMFQAQTELVDADINGEMVVTGLLLLVIIPLKIRRQDTWKKWLSGAFLASISVLLIALYGWQLVGNYLLPRQHIAGTISGKFVDKGSRTLTLEVYIDGHRYTAMCPVYDSVRRGQYVRAEVSTATNRLFSIQSARPTEPNTDDTLHDGRPTPGSGPQ